MTSFERFEAALRALCEEHGVVIAGTDGGRIGAWHRNSGQAPLMQSLVDFTSEPADAGQEAPLPDMFATPSEASRHPGFVTQELSQRLARTAQQIHPRSVIVPIGSSERIRAWAIIKRP